MNVTESTMNEIKVLSPEGRLDSVTSDSFEQLIMGWIANGHNRMVIDFTNLDYISSAGLRVLLIAAKQIKADNGVLALCGLKAHIHEVFEISGFLPILTVVEDIETAIGSVAG
jgi:stage II sporulation protein AA (anti-sigma F factor antagonist)